MRTSRSARRRDHVGMLGDAVLRLEDITVLGRLAALGAPGEEVTADLDVVVGELAVLVVIHAEQLGLLGSAQLEPGNEVDELGNGSGHGKGVGAGGDNGSNLPAHDDIVAVEETARGAGVDAVEADDAARSEEGVEEETDDAADSVLGKHIERVVDADEELDLGAKVAGDTRDDTENDAGPRVDEARGRGGGDESRDAARAPADHGPLAGEAVVEDAPCHGSKHGGETRVPAGHDSTEVGAKGRATVETQPAEPQEDGTQGDEGDVVRAEVHHHLLVAAAKDPRVGQRGNTGSDLDRNSSSIIEDAVLEAPAVGVPDPVGQGAVDQGGPAKDEDHGRDDTTALGDGTNSQGCGDGAEHHLVEGVEESRDEWRADRGRAPDVHEAEMMKVTDEGISRVLAEGKRVSPKVPLENDDTEG